MHIPQKHTILLILSPLQMVIIFFLLQYTSKLEKKISHSENEKFKTAYCLTVKLLALSQRTTSQKESFFN